MTFNEAAAFFDVPPHPHTVVLVLRRGSRVLLCQGPLRHTGGARSWCLPGGKLEPDETPRGGVIREGTEEAGEHQAGCATRGPLVGLQGCDCTGAELPGLVVEEVPFWMGYTHEDLPLWAFLGTIADSVPDRWEGREGRCEFVELAVTPALYRQDWLPTFCRLMDPLVRSEAPRARDFLGHVASCATCQRWPPCAWGQELYQLAGEQR